MALPWDPPVMDPLGSPGDPLGIPRGSRGDSPGPSSPSLDRFIMHTSEVPRAAPGELGTKGPVTRNLSAKTPGCPLYIHV